MTVQRAAIYARISKRDKKAPKVENQIETCEALAADHGYEVVAVYKDDGIAASGKAIDDTTVKDRPDAQKLLAAMRAKEFDVLLAVEGERLARTYLDGIEFIRASEEGGVVWHFHDESPFDPATPAGEENAVAIFASGRREGRKRDSRQKRRYDLRRAEGLPLWGTRPFGFEDDSITLRPAEADLIKAAVTDYLANKRSLLRIAHDWTKAGVLTDGMTRQREGRDGIVRPARQVWTATTVRQVLLRDRNAGIFMHRGTRMSKSQITPIISVEQLESLQSRVKVGTPVSERATTLLGGLISCECGAPMHGTLSISKRKDSARRNEYQIYKCSQTLYDKTRKHASIVQKTADDLIVSFLLLDLYKGELTAPGDDLGTALSDVSSRLANNADSTTHVGTVLLDPAQKSIHAQARGQLALLDTERVSLQAERDSLLARSAEGGALAAFLEEWRADSAGHASAEEGLAFEERFWGVWAAVPNERKQAMIRARYRPVVKVGGRGIERIQPNPVQPSTFGKSLEPDYDEEDDNRRLGLTRKEWEDTFGVPLDEEPAQAGTLLGMRVAHGDQTCEHTPTKRAQTPSVSIVHCSVCGATLGAIVTSR